MANLNDLPKQLSFASMGCDVRNGIWEPYVSRGEANGVMLDCSQKPENHISCKNPLRDEFIADVEGLNFSVSLNQGDLPKIPKFIPILEKSFLQSDLSEIPGDFVGVSIADIFTSPLTQVGGRLQAPNFRFKPELKESPMFSQKMPILFMSGQDTLIESLWMQHQELSLFPTLRDAGFRIATSPNFSVFVGECPLGHRINQKKSLICARMLQEAGITPIPHIYPMTNFHLRSYVEYFKTNPTIRTVIINCTLQRKDPEEVKSVLETVSCLIEEVADLHIILQGLDVRDVRLFSQYDQNIHYAVSTPFYNALFHKQNIFDNEHGEILAVAGSSESKEKLAIGNVDAYLKYFSHTASSFNIGAARK